VAIQTLIILIPLIFSTPKPKTYNQGDTPMTAQKGKDVLLKIDNGSGGFITIGGLRTRQITLNAESVDITHSESAGRWRELLAGVGTRKASLTGAGIFKDEASDARIRTVFFESDIRTWQIILPDFGTLEGLFQISNLEYRGEHDREVTFEISLDSAGAISFTAA
jgi:TP901-1 family phage major tail protein